MRNVSDQSAKENQNTQFVLEDRAVCENVENDSRATQATDDNIVTAQKRCAVRAG